ncbi:MAG: DGQHR domain-containing protein [Parvibaculales bacterium]
MNEWKTRVLRSADINCTNGGIPTYIGCISGATLAQVADVPRYNAESDTGYQRNPNIKRIKDLARDIIDRRVDLPTSVLLDVRGPVPKGFISGLGDQEIIDFSVLKKQKANSLFVVDGQHRIMALAKVLEELPENPNLKIPFVCMIGAGEEEEVGQFYTVNRNAKSVPTDLACQLIRKWADRDPEIREQASARGKLWEIYATELVTDLANTNVWKNRIRLPNEPVGISVVQSASFIKSMKPIFMQSAIFRSIKDRNKQVQLMDNFWSSIFTWYANRSNDMELQNLKKCALFKGVGVSVMHGILPSLIEIVAANGSSIYSSESYGNVIFRLLDEMDGMNSSNQHTVGIDFWMSGADGVVGSYTSEGGKRVLMDRMLAMLPEVEYA